jgi:hypothetical protein
MRPYLQCFDKLNRGLKSLNQHKPLTKIDLPLLLPLSLNSLFSLLIFEDSIGRLLPLNY